MNDQKTLFEILSISDICEAIGDKCDEIYISVSTYGSGSITAAKLFTEIGQQIGKKCQLFWRSFANKNLAVFEKVKTKHFNYVYNDF